MSEEELLRIRSGVNNLPPGELQDDFTHVLDEVRRLQEGIERADKDRNEWFNKWEVERTNRVNLQADAERLAEALKLAPDTHDPRCVVVRNVNGHDLKCTCSLAKKNAALAAHDKLLEPME